MIHLHNSAAEAGGSSSGTRPSMVSRYRAFGCKSQRLLGAKDFPVENHIHRARHSTFLHLLYMSR